MLALKEPWHWPSGDKDSKQHTEVKRVLWFMRAVKWGPPVFSLQTPAATCWWPCSPWAARVRSGASSSPARSTRWLSRLTMCFLENTKVRHEDSLSWPSHALLAFFLSVLKPSSQIASQMYTITCLALLWPVTLNVLYLTEALRTSCHHIRIAHTLLFSGGVLIHAILFLNAGKRECGMITQCAAISSCVTLAILETQFSL